MKPKQIIADRRGVVYADPRDCGPAGPIDIAETNWNKAVAKGGAGFREGQRIQREEFRRRQDDAPSASMGEAERLYEKHKGEIRRAWSSIAPLVASSLIPGVEPTQGGYSVTDREAFVRAMKAL